MQKCIKPHPSRSFVLRQDGHELSPSSGINIISYLGQYAINLYKNVGANKVSSSSCIKRYLSQESTPVSRENGKEQKDSVYLHRRRAMLS